MLKPSNQEEIYETDQTIHRPYLPAEQKRKLLQILLDASNNSRGRHIMKGMMVERFVKDKDSNYDSIRSMNKWLSRQGKQQ
jgi:ABC-type phosphate/phosphonate transport system substrate-binding protein